MNEWLLTNRPISFTEQFDRYIKLYDDYNLFFSLPSNKFFYNEETKSGIFIFGYYTSRLDININYKNLNSLFLLLINNPYKSYEIIKGIYTIVLIKNGRFVIFNDPLGISKYYYSLEARYSVFSGRIKYVKQIRVTTLSRNQILAYYIFNYCLNGNTFFNEIQYSLSGSISFVDDTGVIKTDQYIDILLHMSQQKDKFSKKELFEYAPALWLKIIEQWQDTLNNKKASLTLTAGLDSRILLGSFLKTNYGRYNTFTFGNKDSLDVIHAYKLAEKYNIPHEHIYPEEEFFIDFGRYAIEVFELGDTLVTIYRAHRMEAYRRVMLQSAAIVLGLAGSDLVRGFGYDGLIVSPLAYHCWNKNSLESYFDDPYVKQHYKDLGLASFQYILDRESDYDYLYHNLSYLFKVVIPLHFSQDIIMNYNMGFLTLVPFLDLDYLDFLRQNPFFGIYDYNNFKRMDFKRRIRGLYYSANLSFSLNKEISTFSTGKGFTPKDLAKSPLYAFTRGYLSKILKPSLDYKANFDYGTWFWHYLHNYFEKNDFEDTINKHFLMDKLNETNKEGGELHFLDFVKAINIHMANNL